MPFTLTMPKLSPTMIEGTIVKWHKSVGEFVEVDELLIEVATDKATVEYHVLDSGWLREILIKEGKEARVNQPVAVFTVSKDESLESYQIVDESSVKEETIENKQVTNEDQRKDSSVSYKEPITYRQAQFVPEPPLENYQFHHSLHLTGKRVKASPLARKLAKEGRIDLSTVQGSGPDGRVTSRDLGSAKSSGLGVFIRQESPKESPGTYEEIPLSPIRKVISQRLQEAKSFIPHFYVSMKIDASHLQDLREQLKTQEIKLTVNDFIVKASALALKQHPEINSGFNSVTNSIVRFKTIDISVAVNLPAGLITPIVRHADFKNVGEIASEIRSLAARAKTGKLESHEYKGGSFTISNLGMYGVSEFTAIINPPQAAILAVGGILRLPVIRESKIVEGSEMTLTLSGDHRVIDGVVAAEFLVTMKKLLENPAILLI